MNLVLPKVISAGIFKTNYTYKNNTSPNRRVSMFEIELPIEDGGISFIDDTNANIKKDRAIIAKPGQIRHTKFPFSCYYIHFIVNNGDLFDILTNMPEFIDLANNKDIIIKLFKDIIKFYNSGLETDEIKLQSLILNLIHQLIKYSTRQTLAHQLSSNYNVIEDSIEYIKKNLDKDLSLETLSKKASFSVVHFHNTFKKATGLTLREYVEEQRIKRATNLLLTTDFTLTQIAYECGFSSQSYFSYAFKRKMNMTPREYVKDVISKYDI